MAVTTIETDVERRFYSRLAEAHALPLWKIAGLMTSEPTTSAIPYVWRWSELEPLVSESGQLVPIERGGERRALQLSNPGLNGDWATTDTLVAAVQLLLPGEKAPAHRHSPSAIRFIVEGDGAYTAVDGEPCVMAPGDLVLTPNWMWHDHGNDTANRVIWMDGLDVPFVRMVKAMFFQPWETVQFPQTRPVNESVALYGAGSLQPIWSRPSTPYSPLMIYPWAQTRQALAALAGHEASPHDGVALQYVNPLTGGPVLPTIDCWIQRIAPGDHLRSHRHVSSAVYHVFRGSGYSIINGERFAWSQGDYLTLPLWAWHEHGNDGDEEAILFSIQDGAVYRSLGLYREEELEINGGYQARV